MKKIITVVLLFCIVLCVSNGCKKQDLPIADYPLSADTIEKAMQEWGISCVLVEDEWTKTRPERSLYNITDAESNQFTAGVSSGLKNGERFLMIVFPPYYMDNSIPFSEAENAIVFATRLFGGFEGTHQLYDIFMQEYDTVNTQEKRYPISKPSSIPGREREATWQRNIGSVTCKITLEQPTLNEPQEYLRDIKIASKWEEFYPKQTAR